MLAGETRFLPWAAEEVERATETVRQVELERAVLVAALGAERGLDEPALSDLVADSPDPWRGLLEQTHAELRSLAGEVQDLLHTNRRLAEVGARSLAEALGEELEPAVATYGRDGRAESARTPRWEQVL